MRKWIVGAAAVGALALVGKALTTRRRVWTVARSQIGYILELTDVPMWALLVEDVGDRLPCLHPKADWWFKIGPKRLGTYDDGDPIHSLGGLLGDLCELHMKPVFKTERRIYRKLVDHDVARRLQPAWVEEADDLLGKPDGTPV